jgi:serine/threonine protein kinase
MSIAKHKFDLGTKTHPTHTNIYFGRFLVHNNEDTDHQKNDSFKSMSVIMKQNIPDNSVVQQEQITTNDIEQYTELNARLGSGSFGTAFLAQYSKPNTNSSQNSPIERKIVLKFSNVLIRSKIVVFLNNKFPTGIRMDWNAKHRSLSDWKEGIRDMEIEYNNAVRILAPYYFNHVANTKHDRDFRLLEVRSEDFQAIQEEAKKLRSHRGYQHLHKILHFNYDLGCLFSEFCDGSLRNNIKKIQDYYYHMDSSSNASMSYTNSDMNNRVFSSPWLWGLNMQIGQAVHYLSEVAHIAHIDIKPDNILFQWHKSQYDRKHFIIWKLSDFGVCRFVDEKAQSKPQNIGGTPIYMPKQLIDSIGKSIVFDSRKNMFLQYAVTMFEAASAFYPNQLFPFKHHSMQHFYIHTTTPTNTNTTISSFIFQLKSKYPYLKYMLDVGTQYTNYFDINYTKLNEGFFQHVRFLEWIQHGPSEFSNDMNSPLMQQL